MTLVTGLVDAFSYLALGHVFVANMTGNVVFLGFAVAGSDGFSIRLPRRSGVLPRGVGRRRQDRRDIRPSPRAAPCDRVGRRVRLLGHAVVLALWRSNAPQHGFRYGLIVVLSLATGIQNASIRKLAVPDLTTTVLTMTVTGLGADSAIGGARVEIRPATRRGRRHVRRSAARGRAGPPPSDRRSPGHCAGRYRARRVASYRGKADPPWTLVEG